MMKKILALVLVLAAAVLVCSSCSRKEAKGEVRMVSFKVYNSTGEKIDEISSSSLDGLDSLTVEPQSDSIEKNCLLNVFSVNAARYNCQRFSYITESGRKFETTLHMDGDAAITLLPPEKGGIRIVPSNPAK